MEEKQIKIEFEYDIDCMQTLIEDDDMTIVSLDLLHLGTNRNRTNISKECVEKSLLSFFNKPIIYRLNNNYNAPSSTDVTEHARTDKEEKTTLIGGIIPESSPISYVERDGRTYLRMTGVVYKLYQQTLYKILKNRNGNLKVSIEILPLVAEFDENKILCIKEFKFLSVCLLGENISEGIEGSNLTVTKFSLEDYAEKYKVLNNTEIKVENSVASDNDIIISSLKAICNHLKVPYGTENKLINKEENNLDNAENIIENTVVEDNSCKAPIENSECIETFECGDKDKIENVETIKNEVIENSVETEAIDNSVTVIPVEDCVVVEPEEIIENLIVSEPIEKVEEIKTEDDYEMKYNLLAKEYEALKVENETLKTALGEYQRAEEKVKMANLLNTYSHCYSIEELSKAKESIEKSSFEDFEKSVNSQAITFALSVKDTKVENIVNNEINTVEEVKEKPNTVQYSASPFGIPFVNFSKEFESSGEGLDKIIENSKIKFKN